MNDDLISRQAAIEEVRQAYENDEMFDGYKYRLEELPSAQPETCAYWDQESNICALHRPSAQPEQHEIGYSECANAMLKMWIDNIITDGEYNKIMDKLNNFEMRKREKE